MSSINNDHFQKTFTALTILHITHPLSIVAGTINSIYQPFDYHFSAIFLLVCWTVMRCIPIERVINFPSCIVRTSVPSRHDIKNHRWIFFANSRRIFLRSSSEVFLINACNSSLSLNEAIVNYCGIPRNAFKRNSNNFCNDESLSYFHIISETEATIEIRFFTFPDEYDKAIEFSLNWCGIQGAIHNSNLKRYIFNQYDQALIFQMVPAIMARLPAVLESSLTCRN